MNECTRPALRWFGGKWLLAPWIISHMPPHRAYVEPFGGAASVLFQKPRTYAEVYNDLEGGVVRFFRCLRDTQKSEQLQRALRLTPFSRVEFQEAHDINTEDDVEFARRMVIRSFMGFGADSVANPKRPTGFRSNSSRSGTPAHDWAHYPDCVPALTERLQGVVIENKDAMNLMPDHDGTETLFLVDPPYLHDTRGTRHGYTMEMSDADHARLLDSLRALKGMVMLCGYPSPVYEALGWQKVQRKAFADGARERTEVIWLNAAAVGAQRQISFV